MAIEKKYYENEEKEDIKFPELLSYENLLYSPEQLKDINYTEGKKLNGAINNEGQVITDLINSKLNTQTKQILDGFTFGTSGAIKMIRDADNGLWLSPNGILGKKAGATTFSITTLGDATFAGLLMAASGTLGTITSANITAGTFQTATSGQRVIISGSANSIKFYDSNGILQGELYGSTADGGILAVSNNLGVLGFLDVSGNADVHKLYVNAGAGAGIEPTWNNSITCGTSAKRWSNVYSVGGAFSGDVSVLTLFASDYVRCSAFAAAGGGKSSFTGTVTACPLPISTKLALDLIGNPPYKKITELKRTKLYEEDVKEYKKDKKLGIDRFYIDIEDTPKECHFINQFDEEDIEVTRTVGFLYQCVIELKDKIKKLEQKVDSKIK